jgi:hypothetical protein
MRCESMRPVRAGYIPQAVKKLASRPALNTAIVWALAQLLASGTVDAQDKYAADPELRRFLESMHAETVAIDMGRLVYRKRWNVVLSEAMYLIAPRGTWNESHPAWAPARDA